MDITPTEAGLAARVTNLHKNYGSATTAVTALDDVSIGIRRGEFTAIMGPSGSGKSTLMHIMAGLDTATSGRAWLGDTDITGLGDADLTVLRRRRVGFIFQAFNLVPTLNVKGNILLPFALDGRKPTPDETTWIDQLTGSLGLVDRLAHRPHELSGGQQQRVAIFADEPTGNLDSRRGREVLSLLKAASTGYGQTIAMVTHDPVAASYADRIIFLADGHVVEDRGRSSAEEISSIMLGMEQRA
jgi:putative ABC transport system ATP-binding protein